MRKIVCVGLGVLLLATAAWAEGEEQECNDRGEYDDIVIACTEQIRENPYNTDALSYRGRAFLNNDEYDRAIADFSQIIKIIPNEPHAYHHRGLAHFEKRQHDRAIADHSEAIKRQPEPYFLDHRGRAYRAQGDLERAIADHSEAIKRAPDSDIYYAQRSSAILPTTAILPDVRACTSPWAIASVP
jgi:tetratricopeptide (TPR) repeat protein